MTKSLSVILSASLLLGISVIANADEVEQTETTVEAEIDSNYSVIIPKLITVTDSNKVQYTVKASGDIAGYERIHVVPASKLTLSQPGKESIEATIEQQVTDFHPSNWSEELESTGCLIGSDGAVGTITADGLSAGTWSGKFNFSVERIGYTDFNLDLNNYEQAGIVRSGDLVVPETFLYDGKYYRIYRIANFFGKGSTIETITIPDSVLYIGNYAFYQAYRLTSVTLPESIKSIQIYAFEQCVNLETINIPDTVTSIDSGAFSYCSSLKSISIPSSITEIAGRTFEGCTTLTEVTIPNKVKSIGGQAFYNCTSLEIINIPESLTTIGNYAFAKCTSLKTIYIPSNVTTIVGNGNVNSSPFYSCSSDLVIYCGASEEQPGWQEYWNYYAEDCPLQVVYGVTREEYNVMIANNE